MTADIRRPQQPLTFTSARRWADDNLFGSIWNSLLTIITVVVLGYLGYQLLSFVFAQADWQVILDNRKLFFTGRFPSEEFWRIWVSLYFVSAVLGLTLRLLTPPKPILLVLAVPLTAIFLFATDSIKPEVAIAIALIVGGYALGAAVIAFAPRIMRRLVIGGWLLAFPLTLFFLRGDALLPLDLGFDGVRTRLWSGFMLNILIAVVGIVASFPLGVLLALGRTSNLPLIRIVATGYIELVRGVPLITILFVSWLVLPDFLPSGLDDIDLVVRIMIAFTFFSAAYLAEIVRGGLQSIPRGQYEAASALGLGTLPTLGFIVLPQAIRNVIPALVGQFISLFKDTSLVFIVGLTDVLDVGRSVTAQREFIGDQKESLLFVAFMFWIVTFPMSRLSQRIERRLGVGER